MFELQIETDNAAFEDGPAVEVARILRYLAELVESGHAGGRVYDVNGNHVGAYQLTEA